MISITVKETEILGVTDYPITSGLVGLNVKFTFSERWEKLSRIAVFKCGDIIRDVYLEDRNECVVPWEILTVINIGKPVCVGVYGMLGSEIIIPTIYTDVGILIAGASPSDDPSIEHSPELVQQLIDMTHSAINTANSVREDANNGKFDGYTPVKGVDYWTPEDKQEIVDDVLASLPRAEEASF